MLIVSGRVVLALILVCCIGIQCMYGIERHKDAGLGVSENGLPMVTTDYLEAGADHRVLAVSAETRNIVNYAVMRTSRGDLIDSSPVQRARLLSGKHDAVDEQLAQSCASLLSNPDEEAIAAISALGFGGIYVVPETGDSLNDMPYEQLSANIAASNGTQSLVSTDSGSYYRLTLRSSASQQVDASWQQRAQHSVWRHAWLICLGVITALYCLVAMPRRRPSYGLEEQA